MPMRDRAAQDCRMQHSLALQISDKLAAAAQKPEIFYPLDRAADIPVRPDHGLSAFRYAARASSKASSIGMSPMQRNRLTDKAARIRSAVAYGPRVSSA